MANHLTGPATRNPLTIHLAGMNVHCPPDAVAAPDLSGLQHLSASSARAAVFGDQGALADGGFNRFLSLHLTISIDKFAL